MTNSEALRKVATIMSEVFELVSEEYLQAHIDGPIEKAAASFDFEQTGPINHQIFTQVTRDFVRHLYRKAIWGWENISAEKALTEAVAILEEGYPAAAGQGYYAAFLDALHPNLEGLGYVLAQMARYITERARARYLRWVFASRIEVSDWDTKCRMAEILLRQWGPFLPENLRQFPPEHLANHLSELINLVLSTNRMVDKMLGSGGGSGND